MYKREHVNPVSNTWSNGEHLNLHKAQSRCGFFSLVKYSEDKGWKKVIDTDVPVEHRDP